MFEEYPLAEPVQRALQSRGFTTPTPIQKATLPEALAGRDVIGQARTGTGKTLAYALPIATLLGPAEEHGRPPRALVLAPTRELALQVAGEFEWVAPHLKVVTVYGGTGYARQSRELQRGVDVVVATPGRAIDYLGQGVLDLALVQVVVLDEADEMLSMGFEEDVERILSATPEGRQTMLFSATMPGWARRLSEQFLHDPLRVNVVTGEEVTYEERAIEVPAAARLGVLEDVLHAYQGVRAIVFTHTKAEVDELAEGLNASGIAAEAIHGDLDQKLRERVVNRFRSGRVNVLVGTGVAARGLDIPEVDLVVHYRLPMQADAYLHRSGRTGRAGRGGTVISLYAPNERRKLTQLERNVRRRFERTAPPLPEQVQDAKLRALEARLEEMPAEDHAVWQDVARRWITEGREQEVAGLLALLLGGAPVARSLLTGEEGWATLQLTGDRMNVPQVVRLLKQAGAERVGRIELVRGGAWADVLPTDAERLAGENLEGVPVTRAAGSPQRLPPQRRGGPGRREGRPAGPRRRGREYDRRG